MAKNRLLCYYNIMNLKKFVAYLRHTPNHPNYALEKRVYKNALGIDEIIIMHQSYWDYVDWLVDVIEIDINEWIVECDKHRGDYCLSENFMYWLWWDECDRFRQGCKTPNAYPPLGYKGWGDEQNATAQSDI